MGTDKKRYKGFFKWVFICLLVIATHPLWLPLPASFLLVKDSIKKSDVILVLSGDWRWDRETRAIELYKAGYGGRILRIFERENRGFDFIKKLLNSNVTQEEAYRRFFGLNGIPEAAVILKGDEATSTFDELMAAKGIVLRNNFKSVILVTSNYHMRRALMTARWIFRGQGVSIYPAAIYSKPFHPESWWLYEDDIKGIIMEYLSIGFYILYHFTTGR